MDFRRIPGGGVPRPPPAGNHPASGRPSGQSQGSPSGSQRPISCRRRGRPAPRQIAQRSQAQAIPSFEGFDQFVFSNGPVKEGVVRRGGAISRRRRRRRARSRSMSERGEASHPRTGPGSFRLRPDNPEESARGGNPHGDPDRNGVQRPQRGNSDGLHEDSPVAFPIPDRDQTGFMGRLPGYLKIPCRRAGPLRQTGGGGAR